MTALGRGDEDVAAVEGRGQAPDPGERDVVEHLARGAVEHEEPALVADEDARGELIDLLRAPVGRGIRGVRHEGPGSPADPARSADSAPTVAG